MVSKTESHLELFFQPHVLAFDMLCRTRSFSRAGEILGVSQSTVSRRVAAIEDELGVELVQRGVRPLQLTHEGQLLAEILRKEVEAVDSGLLDVLQCGLRKIHLRMGCITSLQDCLDTPVIKAFSDTVSRIKFRHGTSTKLLSEFDVNELDLFVSSQPFLNREDVYRRFAFSEPNVIVAPAAARLPEVPSWENLRFCGLPKIGLSARTSNGEFERQYFHKLGIEFVESIETDDFDPFLDMVEEGLGWGIVTPVFLLSDADRRGNLRLYPMPEPVVKREIYVLARNEETYRRLADRLTGITRREVSRLYEEVFVPKWPWLASALSFED